MLPVIVASMLDRDLQQLAQELAAYQDEQALWRVPPGITNSVGALCRHLLGNLQAHIGAALGHSGYVRDRDQEFTGPPVARAELLAGISTTRQVVAATLSAVSDDALPPNYLALQGTPTASLAYELVHLATHLAYHLGQINYHRRLVDQVPAR